MYNINKTYKWTYKSNFTCIFEWILATFITEVYVSDDDK